MGSGTTTHGLPYPLESDSFDPAADIQQLATAVDASFPTWKTIWTGGSYFATGVIAGGFIRRLPTIANDSDPFPFIGDAGIDVDPADYAVSPQTCKMRIRGFLSCNAVAPGVHITLELDDASISHGGSGSRDFIQPGTQRAAIDFGTPAANSVQRLTSAEFSPVAGLFMGRVTFASGTSATNTAVTCLMQAQVRAT